jgi:DNA-binding Lrp family transcriptional regulator
VPAAPDRLDATDARLLLALSADPRATVLSLAQQLGLARNTVQTRLARLESGGVLAPSSGGCVPRRSVTDWAPT